MSGKNSEEFGKANRKESGPAAELRSLSNRLTLLTEEIEAISEEYQRLYDPQDKFFNGMDDSIKKIENFIDDWNETLFDKSQSKFTFGTYGDLISKANQDILLYEGVSKKLATSIIAYKGLKPVRDDHESKKLAGNRQEFKAAVSGVKDARVRDALLSPNKPAIEEPRVQRNGPGPG